jgi:predicted house-cleaning NTP pyrophosphatase (Maf/HAM1 superfamily)
LNYRKAQLCSGQAAYEAFPDPAMKLDLGALRVALEKAGKEVLDARVILVVMGDPEVTVKRDGSLLIKTKDEEKANRCIQELVNIMEKGMAPAVAASAGPG